MKLSDKIQLLRKTKGYSQEKLAEECAVSRQAISKWEADIALPETDKLLTLSKLFSVSLDVLLKDELEINEIKEVSSCGLKQSNAIEDAIYQGILIKESVMDEAILDHLLINKVEIWKTKHKPRYWTAIYFTSNEFNFPEQLAKVIISDEDKGGNWFVDLKRNNVKIIVFKDKILTYNIGNPQQKEKVCEECRKLGIPDSQMKWTE